MRFEKVSFAQYLKAHDGYEEFPLDVIEDIQKEYDDIKIPRRATSGSAGHDFFSPIPFKLQTDMYGADMQYPSQIKIPTGIRVILDSDKCLQCYPRSGHGFKYRLQLDNTVGIIDSDYSDSDNEGHIFAKLTIDSLQQKTMEVAKGEAFMQGIIIQYFTVDNDDTTEVRNGGFGSTTTYATTYPGTWVGNCTDTNNCIDGSKNYKIRDTKEEVELINLGEPCPMIHK